MYLNEIEIQNSKIYEFLTRLFRFVNGESRDHRKLLALNQDKTFYWRPNQYIIWKYLNRVKDKFEDLIKDLHMMREYCLRHHGLVVWQLWLIILSVCCYGLTYELKCSNTGDFSASSKNGL